MKNILLFTFTLFLSISLFSQDTTRVETHYHDGQIYDTYLRNVSGEKIGDYVQYSRFGKKYITGKYENGIPVGIWNYYSSDTSGALVQTLDFDHHKELFVDSIRVPALICGPRFFGGRMTQNEYIAHRIKADFTNEEKAFYKGKVFVLSFSIDPKTLKVIGVTVDDPSLPEPMKSKLLKIATEMPAWLPPVCKDKNEVWRFSVGISFN
jgi:hypothetical protein